MMMDTGQRVELVKSRALQMRRRRDKHTRGRLSLLAVMLCCCLMYAAGYFIDTSPGSVQGFSGATMLLENAGGYVLVGVVCFMAAGAITVLCIRSREKHNQQDQQAREDVET